MAQAPSFNLFETALGWIGIAWTAAGICALQTPDSSREATLKRLRHRLAPRIANETDDLPHFIRNAARLLQNYAAGEHIELRAIPVDLGNMDAFNLDIYRVARELGFGETVTYGELARRAGHPGLARETGQALGANPVPIIVPCHRIVAAGGKLGGFSAPGGTRTKERFLALEGVHLGPPPAAQAAFSF